MRIPLVCPKCRAILAEDIFKFNNNGERNLLCKNCKAEFSVFNGCFDFAGRSQEKDFFEKRYRHNKELMSKRTIIDFEKLEEMWFNPVFPEKKIFLNELSNTIKKSILLLGNGVSLKELYFLKFGAKIIYSDISLKAVVHVKNKFNLKKWQDKIVFHAIDAYNVPLSDESVDIVLGYAFVHHLDDLDLFFREIKRILRPGGTCLFYDGAYSSIWHKLKFSLLKPLFYYSHKRWGISPEDLKSTYRGGYHRKEIEEIKKKYSFSDIIFVRFGLLQPLFFRGMLKIFGLKQQIIRKIYTKVTPILFSIDNNFSKRSNIYYNNTIRLIWGFRK